MIFHIVFKKDIDNHICEGTSIEAKTMVEAIKKQQKDFEDSHIICAYISGGDFNKEIYLKQVERWNKIETNETSVPTNKALLLA